MMSRRILREDWKAGDVTAYIYGGTPEVLPHDTLTPQDRNGSEVTIVTAFTEPDDTHDTEVLPMYLVRFSDGYECELWADELLAEVEE